MIRKTTAERRSSYTLVSKKLMDISSPMSVDPIFLVTNECIHLTSVMRKDARWAHTGMAAILGVPPSIDRDHDSLASEFGLQPRKHFNTPVCATLFDRGRLKH